MDQNITEESMNREIANVMTNLLWKHKSLCLEVLCNLIFITTRHTEFLHKERQNQQDQDY